ncbi:DHS-like NAD/FAD-binding domain-containing protein [Haematococcus lacustris]
MAGSLGYADRLKERHDLGGQLGAPEFHETVETLEEKAQAVARMVESASEVFFFTGAGISTSQGIPDFRGPKGIWTLRKKKKPVTAMLTPLEYAKPSFTHMVISTLVALGKARYVCSQNVDSLHLRSGVPRPALAELHGNCFAERCQACRSEYMRDFQVETIDFQPTGRRCVRPGCQGVLVDNLLDWESALPDDELDASIEAAERSVRARALGQGAGGDVQPLQRCSPAPAGAAVEACCRSLGLTWHRAGAVPGARLQPPDLPSQRDPPQHPLQGRRAGDREPAGRAGHGRRHCSVLHLAPAAGRCSW